MRRKLCILTICSIILLTACGKKTSENRALNDKRKDEKQTEQLTYPYTGIATTTLPTDRAIAVMVSNQLKDRPQSGLSKADIVYEILVEGNITRFMAIYHSTPPSEVGPVRSAREYFFTLAQGYEAIYVYQGAANFINDMIEERKIDHLQGALYDNDGHLFVRANFRETPYNSYLQFSAVHEVAATKGYDVEMTHDSLLFQTETAEVIGEAANYVKIDYYGGVPVVEFTYDAETEKYTRYNEKETTHELDTETLIQIDNLLIVEAEHEVFDDAGRRNIDIESGGTAYLLQKGKVQSVKWENRNGRILPVKDGEILPFVPGQTWISFVQTVPEPGVTQQVTIENK